MSADTAPIRPEERFDEAAMTAYLRRHLPDLVGDHPISYQQFPGGKANLTYLVTAGPVELVLRRPPLGPVAPGSHDMAREHRVLSVLHRAFPAAPQSFHHGDDPTIVGAPFVVMERRHGVVVRGGWPDGIRAGKAGVATALVDCLADLHLVDYPALGLETLGRPEGFAARQVRGWTDRWERARIDPVPEMDELAARLAAEVPAPQRAVLLHNDFKLDNTMLAPDGSIAAVLDWDMATLGDPLVDLGTTLSYWGGTGGAMDVVTAEGTALGDVLDHASVAHRYATRTGFDLAGLDWYRALGTFRIAVIVQQIYLRYRRGQTSDERFGVLGGIVQPLARQGLQAM